MVSGSLRATDTIYSTTNQFQILKIPTSSNGTTYDVGSDGQVLKSNGTSVYWASDNNTTALTSMTGTLGLDHGGTGATSASGARTNLGLGSIATYGAATSGTKDTWGLVPVIGGSDGVMEVGKYIDFHTTDGNTADYDVRITAATTGLTLSGTTTGTFSGNLTGNVTGNVSGSSGSCTGNAATATNLSADASDTTKVFYRGDRTWSNTIKQTANAALGIGTDLKIGTARKDLNFDINNGSGTGINDGYAGGITFGSGTAAYAGIYYQTSGQFGSRLIFGTTGSYANGAYARMIIQSNGNVGIQKLSPTTALDVNGTVTATAFAGPLTGNVTGNVSGTAANVTGTVAVAHGGTGVTTANANIVFAGPSSGSAAAPSFRALVAADIPNLSAGKITSDTFSADRIPTLSITSKTSGTLTVGRGGTNLTSTTKGGIMYGSDTAAYAMTAAGTSGQFLGSNGANAPTWKDIKTSDVSPADSKTYSNVTVSANDRGNGVLFFGKVTLDDTSNYGEPWYVKYRLTVTTSEAYTRGVYECQMGASGSTLLYHNFNNFYSGSYYPIYHHAILYPKSGYSAQGAYLGVRIQSARTPTTLARNYTIEILECVGCSVAFQSTMSTYTSVANDTYFYYSEPSGTGTGLQESGDADSPWYLRYYNSKAESAITGGNIIVGTSAGYKHLKLGTAFDITYPVLYAGSNLNAGAIGSNNFLFHYAISIGTTQSLTLVQNEALYIKGTVSGTMFTPISTAPITQTLSSSDDGYVYYYIGTAYNSTTSFTFDTTAKQMLWYKDGAMRPYGQYDKIPIEKGGTGATTLAGIAGALVHIKQVSGTTTSNGNIGTGLPSNDYTVLLASCYGYVCTPFDPSDHEDWYIHVADFNGAKKGSTSVAILVYYINGGVLNMDVN